MLLLLLPAGAYLFYIAALNVLGKSITPNNLTGSFNLIVDSMQNLTNTSNIFTSNSESLDILARTLYGEARNEGDTGIKAVACVIMNRVKEQKSMWGKNVKQVCLKPWQFSCWNPRNGLSLNDKNIVANYQSMMKATDADPSFMRCKQIASEALNGSLIDITGGATYYHTTAIKPKWAKGVEPIKVVASHAFYTTSQIG